jgi:glycosyltransferase involved in cell wall biosynthesis
LGKISVVVTAYNEEGRIEDLFRLVNQLSSSIPSIAEFVIVNNGSTDSTLSEIQHWINIFPELNTKLIILEKNCGYGGGLRTGILYSGYETVMLLPADGKYQLRDISNIVVEYQELDKEYIMLKGIRTKRNDPIQIQFLSRLLTNLSNSLFKTSLSDVNGQPKIFNKELIEHKIQILSSNACFDATLCALWHRLGGIFCEREVSFQQNNQPSWRGKPLKLSFLMAFELIRFRSVLLKSGLR